MGYAKTFDGVDPDFIREILTVRVDDKDATDVTDPMFKVGDSVKVLRGKHADRIGVIVRASFETYIVEPYNDAYWNDPAITTKWGPYHGVELKKVARPKGASTEWTAPVRTAIPNEQVADPLTGQLDTGFQLVSRGKSKTKRRGRKARHTGAAKTSGGNYMMNVNAKQKAKMLEQLEAVVKEHGKDVVTRKELPFLSEKLFGKKFCLTWIRKLGNENRGDRGTYSLSKTKEVVTGATVTEKVKAEKPAKAPKVEKVKVEKPAKAPKASKAKAKTAETAEATAEAAE